LKVDKKRGKKKGGNDIKRFTPRKEKKDLCVGKEKSNSKPGGGGLILVGFDFFELVSACKLISPKGGTIIAAGEKGGKGWWGVSKISLR